MKKLHVFTYSQIVDTDPSRSVASFAKETGLSVSVITNLACQEENVGGSIYQYTTGNLTSKQFRSSLNEKFKNEAGLTLSNEEFDKCWNAMCLPQPQTLARSAELQQTYGFKIHVIGKTNEIQHKYIQQEVQKFAVKPNITYTLSFEEKTLDIEKLAQSAITALANDQYDRQFEFHNAEPVDAVSILANIYESTTGTVDM